MNKCQECIVFNNQPTRKLEKGESLFLEGGDVSETYLINSGVLKITKITESGNEHILDLKISGDKVALVNLYEKHDTHNVSAIALTPVEVVVVNECHFNNVSDQARDCIVSCCFNTMLKRVSFRESILIEEDVSKKILKLFDYLYDFFGYETKGYRVIDLPFNRGELCGLIGVRRETFSRKLSSLSKSGVIKIEKNRIYIKE